MRYLKGTIDFALTCGGQEWDWKPELIYYVDTDGGIYPHKKSISGYVFRITGEPLECIRNPLQN